MKKIICTFVLVMLVAMPLMADELWRELLPDHGAAMLSISKNADGQVLLAGSWDAFILGKRSLEVDVWSVSPLGGGLSWGMLGNSERPRYVGLGYDGGLAGDHWYDRLVVYFKTPVELSF